MHRKREVSGWAYMSGGRPRQPGAFPPGSSRLRVLVPLPGSQREIPRRRFRDRQDRNRSRTGRVDADALRAPAAELRPTCCQDLAGVGIDEDPTRDFPYYDQGMDTTVMVCAVPERHRRTRLATTSFPQPSITPQGRSVRRLT